MKHRAPQFDLALPNEPFRLAQETSLDGERLAREKAQRQADKEESARGQMSILPPSGMCSPYYDDTFDH
jgi:hypothetical protein